jgi:hypothetical protein
VRTPHASPRHECDNLSLLARITCASPADHRPPPSTTVLPAARILYCNILVWRYIPLLERGRAVHLLVIRRFERYDMTSLRMVCRPLF